MEFSVRSNADVIELVIRPDFEGAEKMNHIYVMSGKFLAQGQR